MSAKGNKLSAAASAMTMLLLLLLMMMMTNIQTCHCFHLGQRALSLELERSLLQSFPTRSFPRRISRGGSTKVSCSTELPLPPGRSGLPFLGETVPFLLNTEPFLRHKFGKYGKIYRSHILGKPSVVVNGVNAMKFLAQNQGKLLRSTYPQSVVELLGPNVLPNSDGPNHERARQVIGKAFTASALASYSQYIEEVSQRYMNKWKALGSGGGGEFEMKIYDELLDVMLDIAYFVLIGDNMHQEQLTQYSEWFGDIQKAFFSLPYSWFPPFKKAMESRTNLVNALMEMIAERRKGARDGRDALNLLIDSTADDGSTLSDEDLAAEMIMLLIAGHETSASAATCFLMEVTQRHDLRGQLVEEQMKAMEKGQTLAEQLQSMPLLDKTLQESLRLYPPASGVIRESIQEFEYEGFRVPAGYQVGTCLNRIRMCEMRTPSWVQLLTNASDSFGAGPHICIGQRLALLELKIFLSMFLRAFDFSAVEGQVRCFLLVLSSDGRLRLCAEHVPDFPPDDETQGRLAAQNEAAGKRQQKPLNSQWLNCQAAARRGKPGLRLEDAWPFLISVSIFLFMYRLITQVTRLNGIPGRDAAATRRTEFPTRRLRAPSCRRRMKPFSFKSGA
eukprot:767333-Hanusia_phi.AAC.3